MNQVKWGVLGTARIAKGCTIPGMQKTKECILYAVAGRSLEKAQAFKEEFGFEKAYGSYEELINDEEVQAVYIPLPNHLHLPWVKAALEKKKHVLCEKPLAMNAAEAREMFQTARENGVILTEAYAYLHSPYVKALKEDLLSGIIGDVDYIETAFIAQGHKEDFRLHKEFGGGAMYDLGCYCITMMQTLIDSEPEYVSATAEFSDLGVDLLTAGLIRFTNGVKGCFNAGMVLTPGSNGRFDRLYIHGNKGCIRSDVEYNGEGELRYTIETKDGVTERCVVAPSNYHLEVSRLNACILYGEKPYITEEFSIKNAELIDRFLQAMGY